MRERGVTGGDASGRVISGVRCAAVVALLVFAAAASGEERPARWAEPIAVDGAPNLHKVSEVLYRSAQPSAAGMKGVEALGVKTVLSLRSFHSDRREARGTTLALVRVRFDTWDVDEDELVEALRVIRDPARQPVLVHCQHGADRTGMIVALHRIVFEGWSKQEAIDEMQNGGYGWHPVWTHIPGYVESVDVDALRRKIGD